MRPRSKPGSAFYIIAGLITASWMIYARRPQARIPSQEGLEDPEVAHAFDLVARMPQMRMLRMVAIKHATKLVSFGQAVDLGCGPGYLVLELAKQAPDLHVTGIDLSHEMLYQAQHYASNSQVTNRVDFKAGDASSIPFPNESVDLVISTLSLHHWSNPVDVLDEIWRILRPGGGYMIFDLRRDLSPPVYVLLWFATNFIVPRALYQINEPLGSRNAAYTPSEIKELAGRSRLYHPQITRGPLWLTVEGHKDELR